MSIYYISNHSYIGLNHIKLLIFYLQNSNIMWFKVRLDPNNIFTKQLLLMLFCKRGNWSLARLYTMHRVKQSITGVFFLFHRGNSSLWTGDYDEVTWHFYCPQWWQFWVCYFTDFIQYIEHMLFMWITYIQLLKKQWSGKLS